MTMSIMNEYRKTTILNRVLIDINPVALYVFFFYGPRRKPFILQVILHKII